MGHWKLPFRWAALCSQTPRLGQYTPQRMWTRDRVQSQAIKMIKGMEKCVLRERD